MIYIGIYSTISSIWRAYERIHFGEERPNDRDTKIALVLALILFLIVR